MTLVNWYGISCVFANSEPFTGTHKTWTPNLDPQSGPLSGPPSNGVNSFESSNVNVWINFENLSGTFGQHVVSYAPRNPSSVFKLKKEEASPSFIRLLYSLNFFLAGVHSCRIQVFYDVFLWQRINLWQGVAWYGSIWYLAIFERYFGKVNRKWSLFGNGNVEIQFLIENTSVTVFTQKFD